MLEQAYPFLLWSVNILALQTSWSTERDREFEIAAGCRLHALMIDWSRHEAGLGARELVRGDRFFNCASSRLRMYDTRFNPDQAVGPEGCTQKEDDVKWRPCSTVMLQNIPNRYTTEVFVEELETHGFQGLYDFVYLPTDFHTKRSKGYGFVNFTTTHAAQKCFDTFNGVQLQRFSTKKVVAVTMADTQGYEANVLNYTKNQASRINNLFFRPLVFTDGVGKPLQVMPVSPILEATSTSLPHSEKRHVQLLTLSPVIMERRDVELELLEYLAAPISVQELNPGMWLDVWDEVCSENNDWLEMRTVVGSMAWPFCKLCACDADLVHLLSQACVARRGGTRRRKRRRRPKQQSPAASQMVGPLLAAILEAEQARQATGGAKELREVKDVDY
eukprot:TRINITY_DN1039_c0_g1_i1.p1 TRINITY_DN1039_c0_g1~~TRINITY_DN1039_c0_g1_i1.p1  ORF type:complete len:389 (+),score=68.59 TRINITY_DN1039_c0_g1_i1:87-1253(+)